MERQRVQQLRSIASERTRHSHQKQMCGGLPCEALQEAPGVHEVRDARKKCPLVLVDIAVLGGVEKVERVPSQERAFERAYSWDEQGGLIEEREAG